MKNLIIASVFFVFVLSSCSKTSEEEIIAEKNLLAGTWEESINDPVRSVFVFNTDMTGSYYEYRASVKTTPINFNYLFTEKTMTLTINWINMPSWDNPTDMIEIRNGNILIYRSDTYFKK